MVRGPRVCVKCSHIMFKIDGELRCPNCGAVIPKKGEENNDK